MTSPAHFEQHLEYIQETCRPMHLLEMAEAVTNGSLPPRAVAITLDDGYVDNLLYARPLLDAIEIPATIFITTGYIDREREFWWDDLERMLLRSTGLPAELTLAIEGETRRWPTGTRDERRATLHTIHRLLRPLPADERDEALANLARDAVLERTARPEYRAMTSEELKTISRDGLVDLGAHTETHPVLSALPLEAQRREIAGSRRALETILGRPVLSYAHPYGQAEDFTDETVSIVEAEGLRVAVTGIRGCIESGDDLLRLRRCPVRDWGIETFKRHLELFFIDRGQAFVC